MFVVPKRGNGNKVPCYADLVEAAEDVLRKAKGLGREWFASNAEVMAWSSKDDRGILTPDRFRVTLDMITKDMEAPSDEDM
jgi:Leu/Phe-tRNA-protein transferase